MFTLIPAIFLTLLLTFPITPITSEPLTPKIQTLFSQSHVDSNFQRWDGSSLDPFPLERQFTLNSRTWRFHGVGSSRLEFTDFGLIDTSNNPIFVKTIAATDGAGNFTRTKGGVTSVFGPYNNTKLLAIRGTTNFMTPGWFAIRVPIPFSHRPLSHVAHDKLTIAARLYAVNVENSAQVNEVMWSTDGYAWEHFLSPRRITSPQRRTLAKIPGDPRYNQVPFREIYAFNHVADRDLPSFHRFVHLRFLVDDWIRPNDTLRDMIAWGDIEITLETREDAVDSPSGLTDEQLQSPSSSYSSRPDAPSDSEEPLTLEELQTMWRRNAGLVLAVAFLIFVICAIILAATIMSAQKSKSAAKRFKADTFTLTQQTQSQLHNLLQGTLSIPFSELTLHEIIGRGGFGSVYRATWRASPVAVKKLRTDHLDDLQKHALDEFAAEAQLMSQLRPHPNVVLFLGVVTSPSLCIVTEFVEKGSLYALLQSSATVTSKTLLRIVRGIAAGMIHLHSENIIHRDLAARNVLLDALSTAKVSDFGMSRLFDSATCQVTKNETGPLKWMAPESISNHSYSPKSDVWAFGVVLFEMLTRCKEPYEGLTAIQVATKVANGQLSLELPDRANADLRELGRECMKFEPGQRPNFEEIRKTLERVESVFA